MIFLKPSKVAFAEDKLQKEFENLPEEDITKKHIKRAIKELKQNAFCGIQFPKRLIPKEYIQKYEIKNLWEYDLPDGWRLLYSIMPQNRIEILTIIIEWFNHKDYERKFRY